MIKINFMLKKLGFPLFFLAVHGLNLTEVAAAPKAAVPVRVLQLEEQDLLLEKIYDGSEVIWGMDFLSPSELFFTEKSGEVKLLSLNSLEAKSLGKVPNVYNGGQGGLLDIKIHPEFSKSPWVYVSLAMKTKSGSSLAVARSLFEGGVFKEWKPIFVSAFSSGSGLHFGSRLVFDDKKFLFVSSGERGDMQTSQDLKLANGKVLRLNEDGSIPPDNPFFTKPGVEKAIWTLGHRNPQGMTIHPVSRQIYVSEHGPRGGDEINILKKGANYGWPVISYGKDYGTGRPIGEGTHKPGMEQPLKYFDPSIAPSGLMIYSGTAIPEWSGVIFSGALALRHVNLLSIKNGAVDCERRLFLDLSERFRSVIEGPEGFIYFSTDSGSIYRLIPRSMSSTKRKSVSGERKVANTCTPYVEKKYDSAVGEVPKLEPSFENVKEYVLGPYCSSCHGAGAKNPPLLDTKESILKWIVPKNAEASPLFQAIKSGKMPPSYPLAQKHPEYLGLLKAWIEAGGL